MSKRTLLIDFELYADNDEAFKQELIELMIENLQELQQAYGLSVDRNDTEIFLKACHKVKTTLSMIADSELDAVVEELKSPGVSPSSVAVFDKLTAEIIVSLSTERS